MKFIGMTFLALLSLQTASISFALTAPKPALCPSVAAIQSAGLSQVDIDEDNGLYVTYQINAYDTNEVWFFAIGVPLKSATSSEDALSKAKETLPQLSGNPKPEKLGKNRWICTYNDFSNGYQAHAITPID